MIIGRKTFESIFKKLGKALPDRVNIVITTQKDFSTPECITLPSVEEAIRLFSRTKAETFVIGGSTIYKQFLPFTDKLYITEIDENFEDDTVFNYDKKD